MPRAMWSGVIGFGLVSIPVKLYAATENRSISFHQIHAKCKTRIKEIRWCPHCDRQVDWDEIEKGYEYAKGKHIALTEEDLENLPLPEKNLVQINAFCKADEIDPVYFEKTYFFEAEKSAKRPYALLMEALEGKEMIGIGTVALRTNERLCALRPAGGGILLTTLLHPDEVRIDLEAKAPEVKITKQELMMAYHLIDMLVTKFDPENYVDHYRQALQKLIDAKLEGEPLEEEGEVQDKRGGVVDLMDALKASLSNAKDSKTSSPAGGGRSKATSKKHGSSERKASATSKSSRTRKTKSKRGAA